MSKDTIVLGSDHAGYKLKQSIMAFLDNMGLRYKDLGNFDDNPSDYPKTAFKVANEVVNNKSLGILLCGSGTGEAIVANKVKGIRAANCFDEYSATMSREHNNANILCLGARILNEQQAKKITKVWLESSFSLESRHRKRVKQISDIESKTMK